MDSTARPGPKAAMENHAAYPLAVSVGGVVTSAAGSLAQTANDAAGTIGQGGSTVAWVGTALAIGGLASQLYLRFRDARRQADAEDAKAALETGTHEHAVWGPKYESELDRRIKAEARLQLVEETQAALKAELMKRDMQIQELSAQLAETHRVALHADKNASQIKAIPDRIKDVVDAAVQKTVKTEKRVDRLEKITGSGVGLDETTPLPKPMPEKPKS